MFDCRLSVKGKRSCGYPNKDVEGPVSEFFKNYSAFYRIVKKHVMECPRCPPDEALRRWLDMRDRVSKGTVSAGMLKAVLQTERLSKQRKARALGKTVDPALVNKFIVRAWPTDVMDHEGRLSDGELVEAVRVSWGRWVEEVETRKPGMGAFRAKSYVESHTRSKAAAPRFRWMLRAASMAFDASAPFPGAERLIREATVAEVMLG